MQLLLLLVGTDPVRLVWWRWLAVDMAEQVVADTGHTMLVVVMVMTDEGTEQ